MFSNRLVFNFALLLIALLFTAYFVAVVVPALWVDGDIIGALKAGFVNPYSSGYAMDAILCWMVLLIWVIHDARVHQIRHGWMCLLLGLVPGVATGFALYLYTRTQQLTVD